MSTSVIKSVFILYVLRKHQFNIFIVCILEI